MPRYEVNALTLLVVFIAAGLAPAAVPDHSIFVQPLVGLVLFILLFSYDREGYRDAGQSLGFSAVAGYCATLVLFPLLAYSVLSGIGAFPWFPAIWVAAALALWAIDMSRMGKRALQASHPSVMLPQTSSGVIPVPVREEPVRVEPQAPAPAPVRRSAPTSLFTEAPVQAPPVEQAPPEEQIAPAVSYSAPLPPPIQAAPPPPPQQAIPIPQGSGKPVTIYLNLVGEGLPCLRSVQAEHLRKDYYLIVEPVPTGEAWEFQPGQVVRCQKRNLSSGKALVAVEEAPRA